MNPEDQVPGAPQQAAPVTQGPTDAEYQDIAFKQRQAILAAQAKNPAPPVTPKPQEASKLSQFIDYMKKGLAKQETLDQLVPEVAQGAARGVADAGMSVADKLNRAADAAGVMNTIKPKPGESFIDKWMNTPLLDSKPMTPDEEDALLGKRQDGVSNFVEGSVQMGVGAAAAISLIPAASLAAFPAAAVSVAGGIGTSVTTDPAVKRYSSQLVNAPAWISTPVKAFLAADPKDSYPTALAKSALENVMTFYAIEKTMAVLGVVRARMTGGDVKAAETQLAAVKHDPETQGPVIVHQTEDGKYVLSAHDSQLALNSIGDSGFAEKPVSAVELPQGAAAKISTVEAVKFAKQNVGETQFRAQAEAEIAKRGVKGNVDGEKAAIEEVARRIFHEHYTLGPKFDTAAEAESVGASINEAVLNKNGPNFAGLKATGDKAMADAGLDPKDYNFDYSQQPAQVRQTIEAVAERLSAPKVVQTHAETRALAEDLIDGKTGDEFIQLLRNKNVATKDLPQHIDAARLWMNSLGEKISKLSKAADVSPDNGVAFESLTTAMRQLTEAHESATGLIATSGRALDANKMVVGAETAADAATRATGEAASASAAKDLVASLDKPDLLALARQIRMADGDPNAILQLIRAQAELARVRPTFAEKMDAAATKASENGGNTTLAKAGVVSDAAIEKVNGIRVEAMLSGPKTQVKYIVSHTLAALQMPAEMWWGGVLSGNSAMRQQGSDQLAGLFLNLREAWSGARRSLNSGSSILDPQGSIMLDAGGTGMSATDPMNVLTTAAHLPSRTLTTTAEFFKQLSYRSSVRAQSLRLAAEDGVTNPAMIAERLADDMKAAFTSKGAAINPEALNWARVATFQNPLEYGFGKWIQEGVQKHPAARLIMPFVRTPVNLDRYAWQRFPLLGMFQRQMRDDIAAGGEQRALAFAKQSMGLATWAGTASLVYNKLITGGGPSNPELNRQWRAAGHEPYSFKVPGGWVSYKDVNPSLTALGLVADGIEASGEMHANELGEVAAAFSAGIARSLTNKSFMTGVADALDAASNSTASAFIRLARAEAGSFVPNILNQTNPDHTLREVRGMLDEIKSRIPGLSETLEPRRNILGQPIMKPPGSANDVINPFTFMNNVNDKSVLDQMVQLGKGMAMPPENHGKLKLTDRDTYDNGTHQSPYDRMLEIQTESRNGAYNLEDRLTHLMKSATWQNAGSGNELYPGGKRYVMAAQIISEYQQKAWLQVQHEYPKLKDAVRGERHDKINSIRNPAAPPWSRPQFLSQ